MKKIYMLEVVIKRLKAGLERWQLKALTAFVEDLGLVLSVHIVTHNHP